MTLPGTSITRRMGLVLTAVLLMAGLLPLPMAQIGLPGAPAVQPVAAAYCASAGEIEVLRLVNERRASRGLKPMILSATLSAAAEYHSADMGRNNYFDHTLSDGTSWSQNIRNHGYNQDTWRGENIAAGNSDAYATFMQWVNSPGHDANMLSPNFVAIGIGQVATPGSQWTNYWTQTFGGLADGIAMGCDGSNPSAVYVSGTGGTRPTATPRPSTSTRPGTRPTPTTTRPTTAPTTPRPTVVVTQPPTTATRPPRGGTGAQPTQAPQPPQATQPSQPQPQPTRPPRR